MQEYVAAVTRVKSDFVERIKKVLKIDATHRKLVQVVSANLMRHYWLENGLLYTKSGKLYLPSGKICQELLKEPHDPH